MDTASNIKFNVEGDDKLSQFLEKTQKSFKELNEKSLRLFNTGLREGSRNLKEITKNFQTKQSVVENLIRDYGKATKATDSWTASLGKLAGVTTLLGGAMNALNVYTIGSGLLKTVGTGVSEILNSVAMVNTGINVMAASGFDSSPLLNSFNDISAILTGNQQAIEVFASKSIAAFNTFQQKLNEVNIIFGLSKKRLTEYGDALQNGLEKNLKNSVSSITALNAAYQAASAGFTEFEKNQQVVELAIKANKAAPGSDLFQIGGAIGKGAGILETRDIKELETVTAKWLATEQQGLTTVGEMSSEITDMYASLKNAGIGTKDLVNETQGLVVAFTKLGAKIPDISTQMEAFSRNTISKTPEAQKALEGLVDAQGKAITLNQEYFGRKGIVQGIVDFAEAVGYNTEKIKEVYTETRAFNFVMKVLAQNGDLAKKSIENISKVTSENLTEAFDSATSSSQAKMEQITNAYDEIMISFGKAFQKRSEEGVESIEWYKKVLVEFKEPLISLSKTMVTFFDGLNKVTGVVGALFKMLASITGTILSFRAFELVLGGLGDGFKNLRKESSVIKELYQSNQGLVAIGKQILGLDQQKLLSQDRINKAIKNSTELEAGLTNAIGKTSAERLTSIDAVKNEINAIVARDESIVKGQLRVNKVEESLTKKIETRDSKQLDVSTTSKNLANLKKIQADIDNSFKDNVENIKRTSRLSEIVAQEALIKQGNIGKEEKKQLKELNTEKLRLQDTYNKTSLDQLASLEKQKNILKNKAKKSDRDYTALDSIYEKEDKILDRERTKDRTPLNKEAKTELKNASKDIAAKIEQEELVLLSQKQKLKEANNLVDKETEKLSNAKIKQTEQLNRVTKSTTELAILQQDLNTKRNTLDKVNIAATTQQEKLYTIQNVLRKEQATLDKIRNKDSQEYQQQLAKVNKLQEQETAQISTVQKAKKVQSETQKAADKAEIESKTKLKQLAKEQGLAEGSLIELKTRSGSVTLKNNAINRALVSTTENYSKALQGAKDPVNALTNAQQSLQNKLIDIRTNIQQGISEDKKNFEGLGKVASGSFTKIIDGAKLVGESVKGALISSGVGLIVAAIIGIGAKFFQLRGEAEKLDKTYKDFNKTLEESATKFDRANISFDKGVQGLNKFNDRVEASKKLFGEVDPGIWESIGNAIGNAGKSISGLFEAGNKAIPILGDLDNAVAAIFSGFSDSEFIKRTAKMTQVSDFIQNYELALRGQNKELANGNLLTETSNQKIKARMILTGEDLEREKAVNTTRIESFEAMTGVQKKELEELKSKGDKLNDRDKAQISLLEAEISRREKVIEVSKKQFDDQLKYYEARNLLLDRENKFSNTQVSLEEVKSLQSQVDKSQGTLNKNISEGLDIYSSSIKDSSAKSKQFLTDLKDGSLSVKASIKSLGGEIYKVGENGKVLTKLPDTVLKSIQDAIEGKEVDGQKYSLEQVLNLKETRAALKEAGVEVPKDLKILADKMKAGYKASEGELKLINLKDLEKDLADFSTLSDKYQEKKRQFLSTTKDDIGATTFSTSLKKSLRLSETDLQTFVNALDASSKGLNKYITSSTQKFTEQALNGTLDLTEGLKELGKVESEIDPKQLEKLKTSITGKNKDEILASLKAIGLETEKTLTADSIDFNKFETNISAFVEGLNAVAESGELSSEQVAKKFETFYNQVQGKVTPAAYKSLTETLIGYEKAASEQRINNLTLETNALEQQKKYGLILETDYIKEVNTLNLKTTEENINNKKIELKRLLSLYKESAPQVIKAKAELESLELDLKAKKSSNPVEIAQAESKAKFDILKKDLELGNVTKRQYIEEELKDSKNLYNIQLESKRRTLEELMKDEVKNAKAIKALRKSMESDEKDFNLNILDINRRRVEEQFKLQFNNQSKKELDVRKAAIDGNTKEELENSRKVEKERISLTIKSLEARLSLEKKGTDKFIEIEKQLLEAQLSLRETQVKQQKDRINENIERKKNEFSVLASLEERAGLRGNSEKSLETTRKLREQEVKLSISSIQAQIGLTQKGTKERLALETQLVNEITKLQKTQIDNEKERLETSLDNQRKLVEDKAVKLEKETITGSTEKQLEASRELREEEIRDTIDATQQRAKLYSEGSKQRVELERQVVKELNKLSKVEFENRKEKLEESLDKTQKALEKRQIALEKLTIAGTTNEDLEASRKLKETEIANTIDSLKQRANLYKSGSKERINLEQEIARETLKLDRQIYENQKSRLEQQINDKRRAFKSAQLDLEKLLVLGTSVEDAKKVRTAKEEEIRLNITSINQQIALTKKGSIQRKELELNLKDELIKLDKQRIANKRELIEEEVTLEKTKISKIQALLERNTVGGTFEKDLDKLRVLKEKETQITINSIKKQIASYKEGSKERLSLEAQLSQEITNLQKLQFNNRKDRLEAELELAKNNLDKQVALKESKLIDGGTEQELAEMESMKVKEIQLNVDSIRKQISLYKEGSKERLALEANLQKELNNLKRASLDKEKNLIQLSLEFKKNAVEIENIETEKALLKGDIKREEFEDKAAQSNQRINLLQQDALTKQLGLYQKGSKEYLEILKQLSQLQVNYQKAVVEDAIRQLDRLTKKQNNSIEAQKQNITKQLNSSDYLTKQLQEQIKLEDSRNSLVKATSDYQIGLLEISKRTTGDAEKRATIDLKIAEARQKALKQSQALEIQSILNNEAINRTALEREKIQLSLNKLELDRSRISAEAELRKAKLNKLDRASLDSLNLQLQAIQGQYGELQRSENLINTQISNQAEISQNQLSVIKQQQELAQKNGSLEVEQARQNIIIAGYEKQLTQLRMKGSLIETNAAKEKTIGDLLTKSYDAQIATLNSRKEVMDSTLSSIDSLYGIEQSMAKSDLTKQKLAQDQAKDRLNFLELQQKMERDSFNLEKAKNKIVRERQQVELTIAEINAKQALATSKVEEAKINARKDATDEEKLAAKLAVESAEQGILAAQTNKQLSLEIAKIEEQSEKNKEAINLRNQRNQRLQAQQAYAQTTTNTLDDREVAGQARRFREEDMRSLNSSNISINTEKIISDFLTAMSKRKPIGEITTLKTPTSNIPFMSSGGGISVAPSRSNILVGGLPTNISQSTGEVESNKTKTKEEINTQELNNKVLSDIHSTIIEKFTTSTANIIQSISSTGSSISFSFTSSTRDLQSIKSSIDTFKIEVNQANEDKKARDDIRQRQEANDNDQLTKKLDELIHAIEQHIEKGGNVTIQSPITVQSGGDKNAGLNINKHLYGLATKIEQRQKK